MLQELTLCLTTHFPHVLSSVPFLNWTSYDLNGFVPVWGRLEPRRCHQPPTLPLFYVGKIKQTIFVETLCAY